MRHLALIAITAFTAGLLMASQGMSVELEKYRSTPSQIGGGEIEETVQPLNRSQVQEMQRLLAERGYDPGDADGYIGEDTREAISDFQRAEGLSVTGNPNEETLRALAPQERHEFFGLAPEFEGEREP